ncbi:hypothetical protein ACQR35_10060 [Pseudarthrobacter sp. J1738]|uniref:hypothetical protein n=1 Tax=Pseudarthrobacter sp. J1738 TaxID=3420446 RepID=UPI003D2A56C4
MEYVAVILPSLVVGLIFWFAMRALFNVDRAERQALAAAEQEADSMASNSTPSSVESVRSEDLSAEAKKTGN